MPGGRRQEFWSTKADPKETLRRLLALGKLSRWRSSAARSSPHLSLIIETSTASQPNATHARPSSTCAVLRLPSSRVSDLTWSTRPESGEQAAELLEVANDDERNMTAWRVIGHQVCAVSLD